VGGAEDVAVALIDLEDEEWGRDRVEVEHAEARRRERAVLPVPATWLSRKRSAG
jgi:hypothetical protein